MSVAEICNREVVVVRRNDTVLEAAKLMRQHHVGNVLVVDERGGGRFPVGIVTDRDLAVEIMAPGLDYRTITVGDIMGSNLATVGETTGVFEAIQFMRTKGVRRLPVVSGNETLVGILTMDDLLELLSEELLELARLVRSEQRKEITGRH